MGKAFGANIGRGIYHIYYNIERGGAGYFRQTEIAKKMDGKTEIIQKPMAAGNRN